MEKLEDIRWVVKFSSDCRRGRISGDEEGGGEGGGEESWGAKPELQRRARRSVGREDTERLGDSEVRIERYEYISFRSKALVLTSGRSENGGSSNSGSSARLA